MELSHIHSQVRQRSLGLELTNRCNFRCTHCYQECGDSNFDQYLLDKVVTLAQTNNMLQIYLTGGEPLLHKNFVNIYIKLKKLGFFISIFSNGSIISDDIKEIFLINPPNMVEISIYGFSEESYVKSTYTIMKSTVGDLGKFINFVHDYKIDTVYNAQIMPKISGVESPLSQRLNPGILLKICRKYGLNLFNAELAYCEAGEHLYIRSDGKIHGCPILKTGFEPSISDNMSQIFEFINILKGNFGNEICSYGDCPAWKRLEKSKSRSYYIKYLSSFRQ